MRILLSIALALMLLPTAALADETTGKDAGAVDTKATQVGSSRTVVLKNPLNTSNASELVANILKTAVGVVGSLALLTFVYGGFLWLTSGGEAGKVEQGKEAMKWAIVGLAVVFSSYALVSFVIDAIA